MADYGWVWPVLYFGGFAVFFLGAVFGSWQARASLLVGAHGNDPTPHKIGKRFYYIVPEGQYCRMHSKALARELAEKEVTRDGRAGAR